MDEKTAVVVGGVAAVALAGRGLRPVTKLVMRGVVTVTEGTAGMRRELADLYAEAKAEHGAKGSSA